MRLIKGLITSILVVGLSIPVAAAKEDSYSLKSKFQSKEFITETFRSDPFTGLVYELDVNKSADDNVVGQISFLHKDQSWSEWVDLSEDEHDLLDVHVESEHSKWENLVNTNLAEGYRFRFFMRSGGDVILPEVKIKKVETIDVQDNTGVVVLDNQYLAGNPFNKTGVKIISRAAWGANDDFNIAEEYEDEDWEALKEFQEHEYVDRVIYQQNGELLKWPLEYTKEVKFIAVHHTVSAGDLEDGSQAVRNIQKYHAVNRGWGDIGYHYLIDKKGNIYEGRAGGDMVIGGHSSQINKVSIGIALIGDFENGNVSEEAMKSLVDLLKEKADQYDLNVNGTSVYEGVSYPVLGGHRDYSPTTCPGIHTRQFLPVLRNLVSAKESNFEINQVTSTSIDLKAGPGNYKNMYINIQNKSGLDWSSSNAWLEVESSKKGLLGNTKFKLIADTKKGGSGKFRGGINGSVDGGIYKLKANLVVNGKKLNSSPIILTALIEAPAPKVETKPKTTTPKSSSGSSSKSAFSFFKKAQQAQPQSNSNTSSATLSQSNMPEVRVHISKFDKPTALVSSNGNSFEILVDGVLVDKISSGQLVVWRSEDTVKVGIGKKRWQGSVVKVVQNDGYLQVDNYENRPGWNNSINDNKFREDLEFRVNGEKLIMINEIGIESYLMGLAEVPDSDEFEKAKTIVTAARSYAYYYAAGPGKGKKFPGKPYDIDDSPERSQKYLGYGFEERSNLSKKAVEATTGEIITWNSNSVVIPYFSQSDGRTRSAEEVWNWDKSRAGYLLGVDDTYCLNGEGELWGHGVGISGCGASEMARRGFTYKQIIDYYLHDVKVSKKY